MDKGSAAGLKREKGGEGTAEKSPVGQISAGYFLFGVGFLFSKAEAVLYSGQKMWYAIHK